MHQLHYKFKSLNYIHGWYLLLSDDLIEGIFGMNTQDMAVSLPFTALKQYIVALK